MNKDKVYVQGYVVGLSADTMGHNELIVKLPNMDVVEIDENLVYRNIDEHRKPVVPQFVADWIEKCKSEKRRLHESLTYTPYGVNGWVSNSKNQETFARAWLDGYEVEEEKWYTVKITKTDQYLYSRDNDFFFVTYVRPDDNPCNCHTRKELEDAGFGWVFDCPGIEIEEVEE